MDDKNTSLSKASSKKKENFRSSRRLVFESIYL